MSSGNIKANCIRNLVTIILVAMAKVLCVLFLSISLSVSNAAILTKVVSGDPAKLGQFPWTVSLRKASRPTHFCSGGLITSQHVLTAASCVIDENPSSIFVVTGSVSNIEGGDRHDVSEIRIHDDFVAEQNYSAPDMAILKLASPVELSDTTGVLPVPTSDVWGGQGCIVTGWDNSEFTTSAESVFNQQYHNLIAYGSDTCKLMRPTSVVTDGHFCASDFEGEGICRGDFGSPVSCSGQFAGIGNWAYPCNGRPDVFVKVFNYVDWVAEKTADVDA